jgi:hypothetical protein
MNIIPPAHPTLFSIQQNEWKWLPVKDENTSMSTTCTICTICAVLSVSELEFFDVKFYPYNPDGAAPIFAIVSKKHVSKLPLFPNSKCMAVTAIS